MSIDSNRLQAFDILVHMRVLKVFSCIGVVLLLRYVFDVLTYGFWG